MERHYYDFPLRVLVSREGDEFVAHALELDLLGYGSTESQARKALTDAIFSQISFAASKGLRSLLDFPAPREFFDRWEQVQKEGIRKEIIDGERSARLRTKAIVFVFAEEDFNRVKEQSSSFKRFGASSLAEA